jgi:hypothetical protein
LTRKQNILKIMTDKVQKIISQDNMVAVKETDKMLCDVCGLQQSNIYLDKREKILICLKCIKKSIN